MAYSVLFVCTGNIYRSMSAEYCLRSYLGMQSDVIVGSAGTNAKKNSILPPVAKALGERGIDAAGHRQRRLDQTLLEDADLVVAMADDHQYFIEKQFKVRVPLFDEVSYGESSSVRDIGDLVPYPRDSALMEKVINDTIKHIHDAMPHFASNMHRYFGLG